MISRTGYSVISVATPAPTVRPPSRLAVPTLVETLRPLAFLSVAPPQPPPHVAPRLPHVQSPPKHLLPRHHRLARLPKPLDLHVLPPLHHPPLHPPRHHRPPPRKR